MIPWSDSPYISKFGPISRSKACHISNEARYLQSEQRQQAGPGDIDDR